MKRVILEEKHIALGAKMVPFAGFNMPVQYKGLLIEHKAVRENVGVFDVSHMGEFWVEGKKALDLIQKITTNDASVLVDGKVQYTCFPNGKGGIVDDLLVYRIHAEKYLLVVNAGNIDKDWDWVVTQNKQVGAEISNVSDQTAEFAIQGPNAKKVLQKLTSFDLNTLNYYTCAYIDLAGVSNVLISETGYTGAGGYEVYIPNAEAPKIWDAIMMAGNQYDIQPIGLGARDTLRLEMGFPLYGNDINDETSPIEAGLGWITKFTDTKEFIDKQLLLSQKNEGVKHKLVGFIMMDKGIPRQHYEMVDSMGTVIGEVTSGTISPNLGYGIGMGYIQAGFATPDTEIFISIRQKNLKAKVVKRPFI